MQKQVWEEVDIGILKEIRQLYKVLSERMKQKWDRNLPFEELLFDRWEKAKQLGFGEGTSIYHNSYVYGNVKVGKHTWIGPFTLLDGSGGLEIGDYCSISAGVQIYTHDTVKWALTGGKAEYERAPVKIGNCCYIGSQTVITKGVTIGNHSVIGACSLIHRDVEAYSIVASVPARVIGKVVINGVKVTYNFFQEKLIR
jgi:acetyltransferase-like isoleucine patch superfamily enzyme